jgi:hypothetical protein
MEGPPRPTGVVTGRWAGTNRVQVMMEDGTYAQVESSTNSAEDIDPGERVMISLDGDGRPVDWEPCPQPDESGRTTPLS